MHLKNFMKDLPQKGHDTSPNIRSLLRLIGDVIPSHPYPQMTQSALMAARVPSEGRIQVLDVGCGKGQTREAFLKINPRTTWHGVDIAESNHVQSEHDLPTGVRLYDGVKLPFEDENFDFIYSHQVFEHVRYPEILLKDIYRALRPGGVFFGSLSGLEPYHWHSLFNFTPLGWHTVLKDAGFEPKEFTAGIDGLSLFLHHFTTDKSVMGRPFLNSEISKMLYGGGEGPESQKVANLKKVLFAGHIYFVAVKQTLS